MRIFILIFALFLLWCQSGFSQEDPQKAESQKSPNDKLLRAIARLKQATLLRLQANSFGMVEGQFLRSHNDTLFVADNKQTVRVPINAIDKLWVRGTDARNGAKVGGIFGGLSGAALYSLNCVLSRTDDGKPDKFFSDCTLIGGLMGGAGGAILGAGIGAAIPKWHLRYAG